MPTPPVVQIQLWPQYDVGSHQHVTFYPKDNPCLLCSKGVTFHIIPWEKQLYLVEWQQYTSVHKLKMQSAVSQASLTQCLYSFRQHRCTTCNMASHQSPTHYLVTVLVKIRDIGIPHENLEHPSNVHVMLQWYKAHKPNATRTPIMKALQYYNFLHKYIGIRL